MVYLLLVAFSLYFAIMWTGAFAGWANAKTKQTARKYGIETILNTLLIIGFIVLVGGLCK